MASQPRSERTPSLDGVRVLHTPNKRRAVEDRGSFASCSRTIPRAEKCTKKKMMQAEYALHFCCRLTRHQKHTSIPTQRTNPNAYRSDGKPRLLHRNSQHYKNRGVLLSCSLLTEQLNGSCTHGSVRCKKLLLQLRSALHTMQAEKNQLPPQLWRAGLHPACWTNLAAKWAGKSLQTAAAECKVVTTENGRHSSLRKPAEGTRRRICRK